MRLFDTLTRMCREFPIPQDRPVTLYVCGVTPYDTTHIGHARTYLIFDVLVRYLKWRGAEVRYCQNVTDVDDPLFERAARDGIHWRDLAEQQTQRYLEDSAALHFLKPTYFPRASEEIDRIIEMVEHLIEHGYGYVRDGNVYYDIRTAEHFGAMARMSYAELLATANERGNNPEDPRKRDPLDFVLWQQSNPGEPAWPSPWGEGRPGWHIECSAMATHFLGPQIDIHGGGFDLVFPHHSCEIAQTESITGARPFVQFWMHAGLVWLDGEKMSKSRGNLIFARDALTEHDASTLRWYLLGKPYRQEFNYERDQVPRAAADWERVRETLRLESGSGPVLDLTWVRQDFDAAMADDLDTPLALHLLSEGAYLIRTAATEGRDIRAAQAILAELVGVLGLQAG